MSATDINLERYRLEHGVRARATPSAASR